MLSDGYPSSSSFMVANFIIMGGPQTTATLFRVFTESLLLSRMVVTPPIFPFQLSSPLSTLNNRSTCGFPHAAETALRYTISAGGQMAHDSQNNILFIIFYHDI